MCQLEGSDRGGRESAAELARAGGIDVNVGRLLQPADFGVSPDTTRELYSREIIRQRLFRGSNSPRVAWCLRRPLDESKLGPL